MSPFGRVPPILLVEDSDEDYEATRRALKKAGRDNPLLRCADGNAAMDFFFPEAGPLPAADLPGLVFLDLNLPGVDGRDILKAIKSDEGLRRIPVVVMSTSTHPDDIKTCYARGANAYLAKPVDAQAFVHAIDRMCEYWFDIVELPYRVP